MATRVLVGIIRSAFVASKSTFIGAMLLAGIGCGNLTAGETVLAGSLQHGEPLIGAPVTCSQTVGNPINIINGNKYQREEDLVGLPGMLSVEFVRHYNSRTRARGPFGVGWRHSYQYRLGLGENRINILQGDGRLIHFQATDAITEGARIYQPAQAKDGRLYASSNKYEWRQTDGRILRFTKEGLLLDVSWQGHRIQLHYDREQRLLQVSDDQDRRLGFAYDKSGRIVSVTDPAGRKLHYAYDANNNLKKVTFADTTTRIYHYEDKQDAHNLTGITDERGVRYATWAYDKQDRAILSTHADGVGKTEIRYADAERVVKDGTGLELVYTLIRIGETRVISEVNGRGGEGCRANGVRYQYNDRLQLLARTGGDGITKRYQYDAEGRLIQITSQAAVQEYGSAPMRLVAKYAYKGDEPWPSLITEPSVAPGKTHQWWLEHNELGQITQVTEVGYTPDYTGEYLEMARVSRFSYKDGRLIAADGPQPGETDRVSYHYDSSGRLTRSERALEKGIDIKAFDAYGRPSRVVDSAGRLIKLGYDDRGRLITLIEQRDGDTATLASMGYDAAGHLISMEGPKGRVTVEYDRAGRPTTVTFPNGSRNQWQWDVKDKLLVNETFDRSGRLLKAVNNQYDLSGHVVSTRQESGKGYDYQYDTSGRLEKLIDPLGQVTGYHYNPWGELIGIVKGTGGDKQVAELRRYNVHGFLSGQRDGRGNDSNQYFDDFGQLLWRSTPDGGLVMYRYDDNGRVKARLDENGIINRFDYDGRGRLVGVGGFDAPATTKFRYGDDERQKALEGLNQVNDYKYDLDGRVSQKQVTLKALGKGYSVVYRYDQKGRLVKKELPGGQMLSFLYREGYAGPHSIVLDKWLGNTSVLKSIQWDDEGRLRGFSGNGGSVNRYTYDGRGRLVQIDHASGRLQYKFDPLDRLIEQRAGQQVVTYAYDAFGRLTQASGPLAERRYSYDAAGNRTTAKGNGREDVYRYAADSNRLLRHNREQFTYDATGRPLTRGDFRYEYNAGGRVSEVYRNDQLVARYIYNSDGLRIQKVDFSEKPAKTTYYLYEKSRLIAELDEGGKVQVQYLYLAGRPVALLKGDDAYIIETDWRFAPVSVIDGEGRLVWRSQYTPFGEASIDQDPDKDGAKFVLNLRLPGQYYDAETDTAYNVHRDYDAKIGRYLTSDPMGVSAGLNTYAYVASDPLNHIDLLGLYGRDMHYYMTYFLATVAGIDQNTVDVIAHAAQYIDDNPLTSPVWGGTAALRAYHFTMPRNANTGNPMTSFYNPQSTQLTDLYNSAVLWDRACPVNRQPANLLKAQLYGEYIHAYADTYSHRDRLNNPYGVWNWEGGLGHLLDGSSPDHTYNFSIERLDPNDPEMQTTITEYWEYQEARTLEAERQMFYQFREDFRSEIEANRQNSGMALVGTYEEETEALWQGIAGDGNATIGTSGSPNYSAATGQAGVLQAFNRAQSEGVKVSHLNNWLAQNGSALPIPTSVNAISSYSSADARSNRLTYLQGFEPGDLDGVLLPTPIQSPYPNVPIGP